MRIEPLARAVVLLLTLGAGGLASPAGASGDDAVALGHALVEKNCAPCHAVGPTGDSSLPPAPPFRLLHERYPVGDLEEALAEGIVSGHPAMPEFTFEPQEIAAIIAYLQSLAKE